MDFRVLGSLEAVEGSRALDLGGEKQRILLAALLLDANRVVSADRLTEALWESSPPESAAKALQVYVSHLRKRLGRDRIATTVPGYRLQVVEAELDLLRFERLVADGRPRDALALWRGAPLPDLADRPFFQPRVARLEELRLACLEDRVEQDLATGRHTAVIGELEAVVREHPLRERPRSQLMLALYRSGRQAEALEAYQQGRRLLAEELGLEPAESLKELQRRILAHEPSLDAPAGSAAPEPVSPTAAAPEPTELPSQRKTVTVLFCDLAESTRLGEELDPESLRTRLARWHHAMRGPIERHGGTVEKFIGDAVMAVFGVPHVHEDDAVRAVRAAFEMREALAGLGVGFRIGINTGEVAAGSGETLVTGDAVNTAKRLEEAAPDGEILIGVGTRRLVGNAVRLESAGAIALRGKRTPVEAWRAIDAIEGAPPIARRLDAPLVGRTAELDLLRCELAQAERERGCRLVTVVGAAGVGKSRLAADFLAGLGGDVQVLKARCLPYGDGITFWPLKELVRSAGGEAAIEAAVAAEPDGDLILQRVFGATASSEETSWAVRRMLELLARDRTVVVCLEDLHWAEPTFLDLLEYVVGWSRDAALMLLCIARPDLLETRPRWSGVSLALDPLTEAESTLLLDQLAAEWPIPHEDRARIADAAEGNPLFLEQLVAMLSEGEGRELPPTIQALLDARLDRLEPLEHAVLARASVVGKEFSRGEVIELSPESERARVASTLLSLVRKEFVRPERSSYVGDDGFRFRHVLIRDAAYAQVPKGTRADLHERFAGWLGDRKETAELIGYHLEQSYLHSAAIGNADPELARRAGLLLADAGERALARNDAPAAANLLLRAQNLLPEDDPARLEPMRRASLALWWTGEVERARALLEQQLACARELGDVAEEWCGRLDLAGSDMVTGRIDADELLEVAHSAIAAFGPNDEAALARAWRRVAYANNWMGRYGAAVEASEVALRHARAGNEDFEAARIIDLLCTNLLYGPTPADEAVARCEQMLDEVRDNEVMRANVAASLIGLLGMLGAFDSAREHARSAERVYLELGLQLAFAGLTQVTGPMELLAGDPAAAEREFQRGLEILEPHGSGGYQRVLLAEALYRQGREEEAAEHVRIAEHDPSLDMVLGRVARLTVLAKLERSESLARDAVELAGTTDATNLVADALADLAIVLRANGSGGWEDPVERALELYEQKANTSGARRLDDIVASAKQR
jgi:class 3 adenylate cyclase/tetratricopeptide (TPR) repeat protein